MRNRGGRSRFRQSLVGATAIVGLLLFGSHGAQAQGMSGQLNSIFQSINTTSPTAINSAMRGGVSLGGIQARSTIVNTSLVDFTPPSLTAGCGGIDMFFGSFSFINLQQFTALARAVASNAAGFAFHLALQAVSPQIAENIKWIENIVREMNSMAHNSCQLAQGIVTPAANAVSDAANGNFSMQAVANGYSDTFTANFPQWAGGSAASPVQAAQQSNVNMSLITGNVMWNALYSQGVDKWITGSQDVTFLEELMSLYGSIILSTTNTTGATTSSGNNPSDNGQEDNPPPSQTPTPVTGYLEPTLSVRDILIGQNVSAGVPASGSALQIWVCDDYSSQNTCLKPTPTQESFTPFTDLVSTYIAGSNNGTMNDGLIDRIYNAGMGGAALSQVDQQFIGALPGRLGARLTTLSGFMNGQTAKDWVLQYKSTIALYYIESLVHTIDSQIGIALSVSSTAQALNPTYMEFYKHKFPERRGKIVADLQQLKMQYKTLPEAMAVLEEDLKLAQHPTIISSNKANNNQTPGKTGN